MIKERDLEGLLQEIPSLASEQGIDPILVRTIITDAVKAYHQKESQDISRIYESLSQEEWFVNSFQRKSKWKNKGEIKKFTSAPAVYYSPGYRRHLGISCQTPSVIDQFNKTFGTKYWEQVVPTDKCYLILEKGGEKGMLYSYGGTHRDFVGRSNAHYFEIKGNYVQLQKIVDNFKENPKELTNFMNKVFEWQNIKNSTHDSDEVDLFRYMKELIISDPQERIKGYILT